MADEEAENGRKRDDVDASSAWNTDGDSPEWHPSHRPIATEDDTGRPNEPDQTRIAIDLSRNDEQATADSTEKESDEYAPEPSSAPVEPETPTLEGAIFVLMGAIVMIAVIARVVSIVF